MSDVMESLVRDVNGIEFHINVVLFGGAEAMFREQWEHCDEHKGGVTITNPEADRNSWTYYRPLQVSLSELTADYAKQGRENPSREAYDSLQRQLLRDLYAGDYGFVYSARVGDEWVTTGETCGFGFDWAAADGISLEEIARELWEGHCEDEAVQNVAAVCKRLVEKADQLREVAALLEDKA